jgi:hypothetical protein
MMTQAVAAEMETVEEILVEHTRLANSLGFTSISTFEEFKYHVVQGMIRFGSLFTHYLGQALDKADMGNSIKLIRLYQSDASKYEMMHRVWEAKNKAEP